MKKLQTFDSSYFRAKSCFEEYVAQNYLILQPIYRYFRKINGVGNGKYIYFWKSKSLSNKRINSITPSNSSITLELSYYGNKMRVKFSGNCLKQDQITYNHGKIVHIYTVYEKNTNYNITCYSKLQNYCLGQLH